MAKISVAYEPTDKGGRFFSRAIKVAHLNAPSGAVLVAVVILSAWESRCHSRLGSTLSVCELQCFQVIHGQFNRLLASARCPAIAFNAADKTLAVVVDFDQGLITLLATTRH
jgi:hypothetical protein